MKRKRTELIILLYVILALGLMLFVRDSESAVRDYTQAVIHHTASHDVSAKTIDAWHKERGWDGIGYHYVIRKNGKVEVGRNIHKKGAHAKGRNHLTGIVLTGYDKFTKAQKNALPKLLRQLGITKIQEHHEKCVGKGLSLDKIRKLL